MTPVKFEFFEPDGTPLANVTFEIRMAKSGFLEPVDGIVMPDSVKATTDENGTVTVLLKPSSSLYYLSVQKDEDDPFSSGCCSATPSIKYKFYVPDVDHVVRVQDLIMDPPPSTKAWDEAAMLLIIDAKAASLAAAASAEDSAERAEYALSQMGDNAERAELAASQAADSATAAGNSADAAEQDRIAAGLSATSASGSAASALANKNATDTNAASSLANANSASNSAIAAGNSANSAGQDAAATAADRTATSADRIAVASDKTETEGYRDEAEVFRDQAQAAVGTITGVISDGGQIDLSGGAYPAKPSVSTVWRVTTGGVVGGVDYAIGDQLFYTKPLDYFYKQDGTENVHTVAGRKGDVVLTKNDVGLSAVDNTPDLEKPVSNPVKAELAKQVPFKIAAIGDSFTQPSLRNNDWLTQACQVIEEFCGVPVLLRNAAVGGAAFNSAMLNQHQNETKSMVQEVVDFQPDLVFISLGFNDIFNGSDSAAAITTNAQNIVNALRTGISGVKIVYAEQFMHDSTKGVVPTSLQNQDTIQRAHSLLTMNGLNNVRINNTAYLTQAIPGGQLARLQAWGNATTSIRAMMDGWFSVNMWKIARLGCTIDTVHMDELGHSLWAWQAITFMSTNTVPIAKVNWLKLRIATLTNNPVVNLDLFYTEVTNKTLAGGMPALYHGYNMFERVQSWMFMRPGAHLICENVIAEASQNISYTIERASPGAMVQFAVNAGNFVSSGRSTSSADGYMTQTFVTAGNGNFLPLRTAGTHTLSFAVPNSDSTYDAFQVAVTVANNYSGLASTLTPAYIEGLNWSCTADNTIVISAGVAVCPYNDGYRTVSMASPFTLTIPTQAAGTTRVNLWFHADSGVPTVAFDATGLVNYFGSAYKHGTNSGWRYLGSVAIGANLNPMRQQFFNNQLRILSPTNGSPCELISDVHSTTARSVSTGAMAPVSISSVIINVSGPAASILRFAPAQASCGYVVATGSFCTIGMAFGGETTIPLGNDGSFQYISDVNGGSMAVRAVGYNCKR